MTAKAAEIPKYHTASAKFVLISSVSTAYWGVIAIEGTVGMADYDVTKNADGGWDAKRAGASRASSSHERQGEAYDAARGFAGNSGGGEVRTHGTNGRIPNSNTIGKNDPNPPKDTKH